MGIGRHRVGRKQLTVVIANEDAGVISPILEIDDNELFGHRPFIDHLPHGSILNDIDILDRSRNVGKNRVDIWFPFIEQRSLFDASAVFDKQRSSIRDLEHALDPHVVGNDYLAGAVEDDSGRGVARG